MANRPESSENLHAEVQRTRDELAETLHEIEARFQSGELRDQAAAELKKLETRAREVFHEELGTLKEHAREGLNEAAKAIKTELHEAKETVKEDVREAIDSAKRSLHDATVGRAQRLAHQLGDTMTDTKESVIETVRQNPIPAALIGAGLAWLLIGRAKSGARSGRSFSGTGREGSMPPGTRATRHSPDSYDDNYGTTDGELDGGLSGGARGSGFPSGEGRIGSKIEAAEQKVEETAHKVASKATEMAGQASEAIRNAGANVSNRVKSGVEGMKSTVHTGVENVKSGLHTGVEGVKSAATRVAQQGNALAHSGMEQAKRGGEAVQRQYQSTLEENPLLIAGAALAVGAILGAILPHTEREDRMMGPSRDRLLRRAGQAVEQGAHSLVDKAEQALAQSRASGREPARA